MYVRAQCPLWVADSTGRRNSLMKPLCRRFTIERISWVSESLMLTAAGQHGAVEFAAGA